MHLNRSLARRFYLRVPVALGLTTGQDYRAKNPQTRRRADSTMRACKSNPQISRKGSAPSSNGKEGRRQFKSSFSLRPQRIPRGPSASLFHRYGGKLPQSDRSRFQRDGREARLRCAGFRRFEESSRAAAHTTTSHVGLVVLAFDSRSMAATQLLVHSPPLESKRRLSRARGAFLGIADRNAC